MDGHVTRRHRPFATLWDRPDLGREGSCVAPQPIALHSLPRFGLQPSLREGKEGASAENPRCRSRCAGAGKCSPTPSSQTPDR